MNWFGKSGVAWRIEKLSRGYPWTNVPGTYLNSPRRYCDCGIIIAPTEEEAKRRAAFAVGSSEIRVSRDQQEYL